MGHIIQTGSFLPDNTVTNDKLIQQTQINSSDEWIQQRTGIKSRYWAEESLVDLGIKAAKKIVQPAQISDIKLVVVASMSSYLPTPSIANQLIATLGAENAWGFDINGACSGFVMAMEVANALSQQYTEGYTLVLGIEKMSQILDPDDRSTIILFGDGAGGLLIENNGKSLPDFCSHQFAQADTARAITVDTSQCQNSAVMEMKGREVFNFVMRQVIPTLKIFIEEHQLSFDYLIAHQANQRLLDLIEQKLLIAKEKIPSNIASVANLSAASIPVLLDKLVQQKKIRLEGKQQIVLTGFGAGLAWGHQSFKL